MVELVTPETTFAINSINVFMINQNVTLLSKYIYLFIGPNMLIKSSMQFSARFILYFNDFCPNLLIQGVNGNNGQRMRPTTLDQLAICKLYGCPQSCGNAVNVCDNGEQIYFASRKCDGFNDCSDGSDEAGCERKCCNSFTFRGDTYILGNLSRKHTYYPYSDFIA